MESSGTNDVNVVYKILKLCQVNRDLNRSSDHFLEYKASKVDIYHFKGLVSSVNKVYQNLGLDLIFEAGKADILASLNPKTYNFEEPLNIPGYSIDSRARRIIRRYSGFVKDCNRIALEKGGIKFEDDKTPLFKNNDYKPRDWIVSLDNSTYKTSPKKK